MKNDALTTIRKIVSENINPEEISDFQNRIESDKTFLEEFKFYSSLFLASREVEKKEIEDTLDEIFFEYKEKQLERQLNKIKSKKSKNLDREL